MRFYDIAIFIFIFNLVMGFVAETGMTQTSVNSIGGWGEDDIKSGISDISSTVGENQGGMFSELNWLVENVRLVVQGLTVLLKTFGNATILFPIMLKTISNGFLPDSFISILTVLVWFVYFGGIVQFVLGKSFREAQ